MKPYVQTAGDIAQPAPPCVNVSKVCGTRLQLQLARRGETPACWVLANSSCFVTGLLSSSCLASRLESVTSINKLACASVPSALVRPLRSPPRHLLTLIIIAQPELRNRAVRSWSRTQLENDRRTSRFYTDQSTKPSQNGAECKRLGEQVFLKTDVTEGRGLLTMHPLVIRCKNQKNHFSKESFILCHFNYQGLLVFLLCLDSAEREKHKHIMMIQL